MAKQITQKQMFTELISLVKQNPDFTVNVDGMTATADDVVKFLEGRIESLDKKATKTTTKANAAFEAVDERVLSVLTTIGARVKTITEMVNTEYELDGDNAYSSSKVTASLTRLCNNGKAIKTIDKKVSLYSLAD